MSDDLPSALIARLERLSATTPAAMKATIYDELQALGVDVPRLVAEEQAVIVEDYKAVAAQRAAQRRLLEDRMASGKLTASQAAAAQRTIAKLNLNEKDDRREANRVLRRMEIEPTRQVAISAPTRERLRHWGDEVAVVDRERDGSVLAQPRHELRWAVDRMAVSLSAEEYTAASRLRETWARQKASPKGVDLNGSGGRVPGSRLPTSDNQMAASREWNAIWHRLPPALRLIVLNFICEEAPKGRSEPMTALEFGQLYGNVKDKEGARGVTRGAVKTAAAVIAGLFHEYDTWRADQAREQRRQRQIGGR